MSKIQLGYIKTEEYSHLKFLKRKLNMEINEQTTH